MFIIFFTITLVLGFCTRRGEAFWPPPYKVDLEDHQSFVISIDKGDYDEESELEMIKPNDLAEVPSFLEDEEKYKPLHSHVEYYNRRAAAEIQPQAKNRPDPMLVLKEVNVIEPRPFVAGFQEDLEKIDEESREKRYLPATTMNSFTNEAEDYQESMHTTLLFATGNSTQRNKIIGHKISSDTEDVEEVYDYDTFKAEYYQQLEAARKSNLTFNYTDKGEPEDTPKDAIKKIVQLKKPKNCTKEELTRFGVSAFQCLVFDYKHAKKDADVKKIISRTWLVVRIWICIYLCIAIPCWCQRGWCCCCCRCGFCFPRRRIWKAKKYFTINPPGVLVHQTKGKADQVTKYEPTPFEIDAYEKLESRIRNL